jgi:preprotein translocase subunit SecD
MGESGKKPQPLLLSFLGGTRMGKVKSAIISALLIAVIVVGAVFATVSYTYAEGVKRYNSVLSSITLGSEFTGNAETVIYPEGVISNADYLFKMPEEDGEDKDAFLAKYKQNGGVWVEKSTDSDGNYIDEFSVSAADVAHDAAILADRFGERGYTGYSVSVQDDYSIKLSVPTNYSYAAYRENDTTTRSTALSAISQTFSTLTLSGGLSLRNTEVGYKDSTSLSSLSLTKKTEDINSYFKSISKYGVGQSYAVKLNLTSDGATFIESATTKVADSSDQTILFYIGESQLLSLTCEESLSGSSFYISANDSATASDYSIVLSSVVSGNTLSLVYSYDEIVSETSEYGTSLALFFAIGTAIILLAFVIFFIVRYKWLGAVKALLLVGYALAMLYLVYLLPIVVTVPVALTMVAGLVLTACVDLYIFEAVRKETKLGRTMQSSVKTAYKKSWLGVLDLHIVLLVASICLLLIGVGEISACGFALMVAVIVSYLFHWITRFLWYIESTPAKDKFAFCGMKREAYEDD